MTPIELAGKAELAVLGTHITTIRGDTTKVSLGKASGLNPVHLKRIEKGEKNLEFRTLVKLMIGTHKTIYYLFTAEGDEPALTYTLAQLDSVLSAELDRLGKRIRALVVHRGLDQEDLGLLATFDYSDISKYINGRINLTYLSLVKMAQALQVPTATLFNYNGPFPGNEGFTGKLPW